MTLHPALGVLAHDGAPLDTPLAALRETSDRTGRETAGPPPPGVDERDVRIEVGGHAVGARLYRAQPADGRAASAIVYLHGGGWATGSPDGFAAIARNLARFSGGLVVSVDYRLAPEHRWPAQLDDALAAVRWMREQAAALGVDASRVALAGDSAGAHLALSAALALRDTHDSGTAPPCGVLAFYPCLDPSCDTPSWESLGTGHFLTRTRMLWFWQALLGPGAGRPTPSMSPWLAEDLSGLPPIRIMTAEHDPLRDEGEAFAHDLREAGVTVEFERREAMLHGFLRWRTLVGEQADDAIRAGCDWLARQGRQEAPGAKAPGLQIT